MTDGPPPVPTELALLSIEEMYTADAAAIAAGVSGETLMEAAGHGIADAIQSRWEPQPVVVLCGPGNNGGDGFVVARLLGGAGWPVRLALLGERAALKGDAAAMAERWDGPIETMAPALLDAGELVVDALFGAGLARPLDGVARAMVDAMIERRSTVVAVDVPSGLHGDSGAVLGAAPHAALTVTFFRQKPGHLLLPGRLHCGETVTVDIGTPEAVLDDIRPRQALNAPMLWLDAMPRPSLLDHKYSRGLVMVAGGDAMTGAARLAVRGAARIGAGMVTIAAPREAVPVYAAGDPGVIVHALDRPDDFRARLDDPRLAAVLVGPGNGVSDRTRSHALMALGSRKPVVLDADALSVFADDAAALGAQVRGPCVLTPHAGEFARLFGAAVDDKLAQARAAAEQTGAVVVLKGGDTVVAAPDGRAAIASNAPPALATAGAGDVLAGMVTGLLGQGMETFAAACAAVWIHGEAAALFGPGLVAADIPELIPDVLSALEAPDDDWESPEDKFIDVNHSIKN